MIPDKPFASHMGVSIFVVEPGTVIHDPNGVHEPVTIDDSTSVGYGHKVYCTKVVYEKLKGSMS